MRRELYYLFFLFLTIIFTSCSNGHKTFVIGISQCSQDEWRKKQNFEMEREATFYDNLKLEVYSVKDDNNKQIKDIEHLIDENVDLIIVSPNEAKAVTPAVEKAFDKGIPVIVIDRKISSNKFTAYIAADNYEIGHSVGEYISAITDKPQKVFEIGGLAGSTPAIERHEGFVDAIRKNQNIIYLGHRDAGWNMKMAEMVMDSVLNVHPDINVLVAQNDRMAIGALKVAKKYGKEKSIKFTGVDALTTQGWGVDNVMKGNMTATFVYPTGGEKIIQTAMNILESKNFNRETILQTALVDHSNARIMMMQDEQIGSQDEKIKILSGKIDNYLNRYNTQKLLLVASVIILILLIVISVVMLHAYWEKVRMNKLLEDATRAKLQFFTNVSHDLRTPLTLISDPLEQIIKEGAKSETQKELLPIINKNVNILLKLVSQVLDFRKYESGKIELSVSFFNLPFYLNEWSKAFTGSAMKKHIKLQLIMPEEIMVEMDREKIERIYFNIVSNALKYTPDNGEIKTEVKRCEYKGDEYVEIIVADNGSGIDAGHIKKLFDNFYQADKHHAGSGIGLALVKAFVELHNGDISVESTQGKGTAFTIHLPLKQNKEIIDKINYTEGKEITEITQGLVSDSNNSSDIYNDEISNESSTDTLLVVDDNPDVCSYIVNILKNDYKCICACNGEQGLAKALRYIPDVIISDVMMPKMDGIELTRRLKDEVQTSHIPIILLTACDMDEQRIKGFQQGADSYIAKPFNMQILKARIENLLENRKRLRKYFISDDNNEKVNVPEIDKSFIQRFYDIVDEKMQDSELSVDFIGSEMGIGRTQLYRKIKALTNYSPVELVRMRRLKKAHFLLASCDKSISEIAYLVGFSSPSYFTKCYKDEFGENPNDRAKKY